MPGESNKEHLAIVLQGADAIRRFRSASKDPVVLQLNGAALRDASLFDADLSRASLGGADLRGAELRGAELRGAYLRSADLRNASLIGANLFGADLQLANLSGADLRRAYLVDADLRRANVSHGDLSNADLRRADFREADLRGADLKAAVLLEAKLEGTDLHGADLSSASMIGAKLRGAYLRSANCSAADLSDADLRSANLVAANFSRANLSRAHLADANLSRVDLSEAVLRNGTFVGAQLRDARFRETLVAADLTSAFGLEGTRHFGRSHVSHGVLLRPSSRPWPIAFLRACGLTDFEIEHTRGVATTPIEFYSCFVSYSTKDDKFAVKLHDALQARGIRCWLDKHEVLPGDELQPKINEGIRQWDKVLLLGSKDSLTSSWVRKEITRAIEKEVTLEKERGKRTLAIIPLDLDGFLFDQARCEFDWAADMRARHAAKFVGWETNEMIFDTQIERVVKALRADELARPKPPVPRL